MHRMVPLLFSWLVAVSAICAAGALLIERPSSRTDRSVAIVGHASPLSVADTVNPATVRSPDKIPQPLDHRSQWDTTVDGRHTLVTFGSGSLNNNLCLKASRFRGRRILSSGLAPVAYSPQLHLRI